ncbi:RND family efflux transporter, MFP subunit [Terriglobus roseus DSM 18391]|uniref:RND family efflux transporter, MFP subunit n=1 Tax=Terriglobus roseus (strain DSM 18391 / NRRL B-41598 / KBS 63) TaxID=926566 RepID=I3ZK12_TERRK|nr:efflux RND transporter periplasmic adaptor subunit [Terriglobus roseus]AFL89580.1 RND family efflux transporter, MFP subunit [Terriglobus roseus DSM 18391]
MFPAFRFILPPFRVTLVTVLAATSVLSFEGCKKETKAEVAAAQTDPLAVKVPPALRGSLKLGAPHLTDVSGTLQVSGRVETDASRIARVGSPVAGRILKLNAFEGQNVRAGTVLAMLHSTNLSDTQLSLIKAYSTETLAQAATKRAEQLVEADVIGRAELERRRAELVQASAEVSSYETQLRGLGMTSQQLKTLQSTRRLSADYPIVTPRGGTVLERKVTVGQVIQPADPAYTIADLSSVWIVANVPEEEAAMLHKGLEVSVRIPARPEQSIRGALSYVAPTVDPATRTVEVRMDLANTQGLFKPDELASVTFNGHTERKLTIPQTAIVREENKDYIFVKTSADNFLLREVELGDESKDERVVLSGVNASETVVLDGAFHLNNQRKQDAIKGSH